MTLVALIGLATGPASASDAGPADSPRAIISLTFDDALKSQLAAADILRSAGLVGAFYVNTALLGSGGHMTLSDVQGLAQAGDEIGGHTLTHANLAVLSEDAVWREVCADRANLVAAGMPAEGFAYPYGEPGSYGEEAAAACGYGYARLAGGLHPEPSCDNCPPAEPLGPAHPYDIRAWSVMSTTDLEELQGAVTDAEAGQGLLTIVFHNVCAPACSLWSVSPATFRAFVSWLSSEAALGHLAVETPAEALGFGSAYEPAGPNLLGNPTFARRGSAIPCWSGSVPIGSGKTWIAHGKGATRQGVLLIAPASTPSGRVAAEVEETGAAGCAGPMQTTPLLAQITYRSTGTVRLAILISQNGSWTQWDISPAYLASDTWSVAQWHIPLLPASAAAVRFRVEIDGPGAAAVRAMSLRAAPRAGEVSRIDRAASGNPGDIQVWPALRLA